MSKPNGKLTSNHTLLITQSYIMKNQNFGDSLLLDDAISLTELVKQQRKDNTLLVAEALELKIRVMRQKQHIQQLEAYIAQLVGYKN